MQVYPLDGLPLVEQASQPRVDRIQQILHTTGLLQLVMELRELQVHRMMFFVVEYFHLIWYLLCKLAQRHVKVLMSKTKVFRFNIHWMVVQHGLRLFTIHLVVSNCLRTQIHLLVLLQQDKRLLTRRGVPSQCQFL